MAIGNRMATPTLRANQSAAHSRTSACLSLWLCVGTVCVGAVLRFTWLTRESLWLDEIFSVWMARQPFREMWRMMSFENHPPLYYLVLHAWLSLFGNSDFAARALSACCGVLTIMVVGYTGWRLRGPAVGALIMVFAAVLPPLVRYGQEARMYALVALFCSIALAGALFWLQRPERSSGWTYTIAMTLAVYTHYYAVFVWFGLLLGGAIAISKSTDCKTGSTVRRWLIWNLVPLGGLLLWVPILMAQWRANSTTHWLLGFPAPDISRLWDVVAWCFGWFDEKDGFGPGWSRLQDGRLTAFLLVASAVVMAGLVIALRHENDSKASHQVDPQMLLQDKSAAVCLLSCTLTPLLLAWSISQFKMIWQFKYLLATVPSLLGLAIAGLLRLRYSPAALFLVGMLLLGSSICATIAGIGRMGPFNEEEWREAAGLLQKEWRSGDQVVVQEPQTLPPYTICLTHYGFPESHLTGIRGDLSRPDDKRTMKCVMQGAPRVWLVTHYAGGRSEEVLQQSPEFILTSMHNFRTVEISLYERRHVAGQENNLRGAFGR